MSKSVYKQAAEDIVRAYQRSREDGVRAVEVLVDAAITTEREYCALIAKQCAIPEAESPDDFERGYECGCKAAADRILAGRSGESAEGKV